MSEPKSLLSEYASPKLNLHANQSRMFVKETLKKAKRKFYRMAQQSEEPQEFFSREEIAEMLELGTQLQTHIKYAYKEIQVKNYEQCKCLKCLQTSEIIAKRDVYWFTILDFSVKEFLAPNLHVQSWQDRNRCEAYENMKRQYTIYDSSFATCVATKK